MPRSRLRLYHQHVVVPDALLKLGTPSDAYQVPRPHTLVMHTTATSPAHRGPVAPRGVLQAATLMALVAGQQGTWTRARQGQSTWRLRQGDVLGVRATLRGAILWNALEALLHVARPRRGGDLPRVSQHTQQGWTSWRHWGHRLSREWVEGTGGYTAGLVMHRPDRRCPVPSWWATAYQYPMAHNQAPGHPLSTAAHTSRVPGVRHSHDGAPRGAHGVTPPVGLQE